MNIYVGSLQYDVTEDELRTIFETYGAVDTVKIIMDKFSGRSKGFGFIEMTDNQEAEQAIQSLNGTEINGRRIVVNLAAEKKERPRRSGGFERRNDYRSNR
jgi:RNA recognition motif-containing protein